MGENERLMDRTNMSRMFGFYFWKKYQLHYWLYAHTLGLPVVKRMSGKFKVREKLGTFGKDQGSERKVVVCNKQCLKYKMSCNIRAKMHFYWSWVREKSVEISENFEIFEWHSCTCNNENDLNCYCMFVVHFSSSHVHTSTLPQSIYLAG